MPTGYTAGLYEGEQTFEEYAMGVARGFGALIDMRDDPSEAEVPEAFEPSPYYAKRLADTQAEMAAVLAWTAEEAAAAQHAERMEAIEYRSKYVAARDARRKRYEQMLVRAREFEAPTPEHEEFAKTLVEQLERSIEFDCGGSYTPPVPPVEDADEYRARRAGELSLEVDRARDGLREEEERARGRTEWVRALRAAIGGIHA